MPIVFPKYRVTTIMWNDILERGLSRKVQGPLRPLRPLRSLPAKLNYPGWCLRSGTPGYRTAGDQQYQTRNAQLPPRPSQAGHVTHWIKLRSLTPVLFFPSYIFCFVFQNKAISQFCTTKINMRQLHGSNNYVLKDVTGLGRQLMGSSIFSAHRRPVFNSNNSQVQPGMAPMHLVRSNLERITPEPYQLSTVQAFLPHKRKYYIHFKVRNLICKW